jgi:hypothetical protein
MSKKLIGAALGALILAVAAPLLTLALLHGFSGTAQAQAPLASFTKANVPDFGQHSKNWCWVGAAANSFWWYAHDPAQGGRQDGLLGGVGHPWEAIWVPSWTPLGNPWYDSQDALQGHGGVPVGYMTLLAKIANTTFQDSVIQDGIWEAGENTSFYADGVEKWDYLIGLRDYVNLYGSGLKVHDIIDPIRCPPGSGWTVNRTNPGHPARSPCGPGGAGGVPGVDQVQQPPTFTDYQTELSSSGHDVLLWMEPTLPSSLETAHVVTGVGYNTVPAPGTVTISDPWTRNANPPVAPHSDTWNNANPSHNNASGNNPSPYDVCTVVNPGAPFQITCGGTGWTIYDMIFVSPLVVNKQVADVVLDDGSNDPQPGNELILLSEEPLARTSNYEYATTDPDFKYLKTTNVKVSVTSLDVNLGPDVPDDAYVSFLADVPAGCEGRWIPQASPGGFVDTLTTADTFTDPLDPMTQTGGTIIDPSDPHYIQKVPGDGDPNTIESDLHFQTADWGLEEPAGGQLSLLRFFEFDCWEPGDFTFTFYNKIEPKPLDADIDPSLANNWWKATMVVHSLHNADIEILSWSAPSPQSGNVGEPFQIAADEVKHNAGPQAAWSDVTWTAQEPQGGEVSARWIAQPGDTQPSDEVLQFQVDLTAISVNLALTRNLELTCNTAGGPYTVTLINAEFPINPDPPHERWEDPDQSDNSRTTNVLVNCTEGTQETKWAQMPDQSPMGLDVSAYQPFVLADDFQCTESGMITEIDFWGSWYQDELPGPIGDPNMVSFTLSLHSDVAAGQSYSHPKDLLWMHMFGPGECTAQLWSVGQEGWFEPTGYYEPFADTQIWLYSCHIPTPYWFQQAVGTVYWLDVQAMPTTPALFGWKTSLDHWNDDGVWAMGTEPIGPSSWQPLVYPPMHPMAGMSIDLAFQIWGQECPAGVDTDLDKFNDNIECYLPTDARDNCPDSTSDDAWPLDNDITKDITVTGDVFAYVGRVGAHGPPSPSPNWRQRLDLDMSGDITVTGDVFQFVGKIGQTCT